jgi:hypothetical protein
LSAESEENVLACGEPLSNQCRQGASNASMPFIDDGRSHPVIWGIDRDSFPGLQMV